MNAMPCPLGCSAHVTPRTIETHFERCHPAHHVHIMEAPICPHVSFGLMHMYGPRPTLLDGAAVPMTVN